MALRTAGGLSVRSVGRSRPTSFGLRWGVFAGALVVWQFAVRLIAEDKREFFRRRR